jgi:hypothetical protein
LSKNQLNSNADVTSHQPKSTQSKSLSLHARTGPSLLTTTGLQSMNDHRFEYASTPSAHLCIAMVGALSHSTKSSLGFYEIVPVRPRPRVVHSSLEMSEG